jgi:BRCT domain type II-containing protein
MSPMGQNRDVFDQTNRIDISRSQILHERSGAGRVRATNHPGASFVGNKHISKGQGGNLKNSNIDSTNSQRSKRSHSSLHPSVLDLDNRRGMQEIISHTNKKSRPPHSRATRIGVRRRSSKSRRTKAAGLTKDNSFVQTAI